MEENTWEDCLSNYSAISTTLDLHKAKALMDTADSRIEAMSKIPTNSGYLSIVFENYYSSAMEYAQALVITHGLKITNHICLGYFLRDMLGKEELFKMFDKCRKDRNSLVYYGKQLPHEVAKLRIKWLSSFINQIKELIKLKINQNL